MVVPPTRRKAAVRNQGTILVQLSLLSSDHWWIRNKLRRKLKLSWQCSLNTIWNLRKWSIFHHIWIEKELETTYKGFLWSSQQQKKLYQKQDQKNNAAKNRKRYDEASHIRPKTCTFDN
jgi:hypothetical protein